MGERLILCGEAGARRAEAREVVRLSLTAPRPNITLRLEDISRRMVAHVPDLLTDLVEIATYVFCADQAVSRGGDAMRTMGTDWRRRFRFVLPLRAPNHWSSPGVVDALTDVLSFLSDDEFQFEFTELSNPLPFQSYLDLEREGPTAFEADEVVLFSGGVDALAGALEELTVRGSRVVLVSHRSSPKMYDRQRYLAGELARRFRGKVLHVPVRVTKHGGLRAVENTQRTRSFLFAALAIAVARILGRSRIRFFENGVTSFNLPIAWQLVGARATRTTHPRVLYDLARFLTNLLGDEIEVDNPFVWRTKTDVARLIAARGHADLIRHSVSCSRVYSMTRLHTHCGTCSQCLDRRFAMLAAGLEDEDPAEMYRVELLGGVRKDGEERTMAESFVRRALEFRRITELGFAGQCAGEISRTAFCFSGMTPDEVARSTFELHRHHGDAVYDVLTNGVRGHAEDLVNKVLPTSCILQIAVGEYGRDFDQSPIRDQVEAALWEPDTRDLQRSSEIRMALDEGEQRVLFDGVPPVGGPSSYSLVQQLAVQYREDLQAGRAPENYRYMGTAKLADALSIEEPTLRRRVSRFRKRVAELFEVHCGLPLTEDAIIETKGSKGYRINPSVRLVDPTQITVVTDTSRFTPRDVTAPLP